MPTKKLPKYFRTEIISTSQYKNQYAFLHQIPNPQNKRPTISIFSTPTPPTTPKVCNWKIWYWVKIPQKVPWKQNSEAHGKNAATANKILRIAVQKRVGKTTEAKQSCVQTKMKWNSPALAKQNVYAVTVVAIKCSCVCADAWEEKRSRAGRRSTPVAQSQIHTYRHAYVHMYIRNRKEPEEKRGLLVHKRCELAHGPRRGEPFYLNQQRNNAQRAAVAATAPRQVFAAN